VDELLKRIGLSDEKASGELAALFTEKTVASDDILFDYGEPAEELYFLKDGHLAVYKFTGFLEKMQVIALLDSGAVVGECAVLHEHLRSTRVTAIKKSTLLVLTKKSFMEYQQLFPESASRILTYLLSIVSLRLEKTSGRLARIL